MPVKSSGKKSDFFSSFFPDFYFSFSHKAPKMGSTCVSYDATYSHSHKALTLDLIFGTITGERV